MEGFNFSRKKITKPFPPTVTAKWSAEVLNEGFVPFPKRLLRSMGGIFHGPHAMDDLAVVLSVADYRRPDLQRPPSLAYLAWNAGISVERFQLRLADLENRGLLKRTGPTEEISIDLSPLEEFIDRNT